MRFMIIVKATNDFEAGSEPEEALRERMAAYHEQLAKAGVLLDASGLEPSSAGWRVEYDGETRRIVDGPFRDAKEFIAGYALIQVKTRDEALEWTRRFPSPAGEGRRAAIEARPLVEIEDAGLRPPDGGGSRLAAAR
jgi:hypothetical protein